MTTILTLSAIGIPPYSARGLKQTLTTINAATNLRRTVNGDLEDVSDPLFRKYESTITGEDVDPPAFGLVFPGRILTVGCISELAIQDSTTDPLGPEDLGRTPVTWPARSADGFIFFRPLLTMRVTGWNTSEDEYGKVVNWTLSLEEV